MKAKFEKFRIGKIDIPVLRLKSENEEDKENLDEIFAAEKIVPVAIGDHPDYLDIQDDGVKNRIVSLILD